MSKIDYDFDNGNLSLSQIYEQSLMLSEDGDELIIPFDNLYRVIKLDSFEYESTGELETRTLLFEYRLSREGVQWSDWIILEPTITNFPPYDPLEKMWIEVKVKRLGNKVGNILFKSLTLKGTLLRNVEESGFTIGVGDFKILKPPYIYKVFKITDIELITNNAPLGSGIGLKWRFSQDNSRTWSEWEPLTKENITTKRINPIRFFQIEYRVENLTNSPITIADINLIGDYQNVSLDSIKTNLFGIRACCQTFINGNDNPDPATIQSGYDPNGIFHTNTDGTLQGNACPDGSLYGELTAEERANLFNPYQQQQAIDLLNKMSNDAVEIFGHRVKYMVTDPDEMGIDYSLHEYGTFNISCERDLKVSVDNNQFPDNQIKMDQFDLSLFDSFEIHITKELFKSAFGVSRRPSKEDLVYFCDLNRLFIVDHAQPFRNFNNYAVFYKVILKKYNESANVIPGDKTMEQSIKNLTEFSTFDLMKVEKDEDKRSIANKEQQKPLSIDDLRLPVLNSSIVLNNIIIKEFIENSTTIISKQHYDMILGLNSSASFGEPLVKYNYVNPILKKGDNISFFVWFNLNNIISSEEYGFFHHRDGELGWKTYMTDNTINVILNDQVFEFILTEPLQEEVWYCYLVNINQRQRKIEQYLYKRNTEIEEEAKYLSSTVLKLLSSNTLDMEPVEYELVAPNTYLPISDMKVTNIRLFNDVIPITEHSKLMNQYLIGDDSKYLVFADNASMKLNLPRNPYNGTSFD